jgi:hypothetical protein
MCARYATEHDRLLERVCELLGAPAHVQGNDDALLTETNLLVNQALQLCPTSVDGWLLKCQVASASHDDVAALAAIEMALRHAPHRPDALYWRGAILGDLGRPRDALRSIEAALTVLGSDDHWPSYWTRWDCTTGPLRPARLDWLAVRDLPCCEARSVQRSGLA